MSNSSDKLLDLDKDQREFLQKVRSYCGLDKGSVQSLWEYTVFATLLDIAENPDKPYNVIQIPFMGKILFKESKEYPGEYDTFLALNDTFKNLAKKVKNGDLQNIIDYYSEKFVKGTVRQLEQETN